VLKNAYYVVNIFNTSLFSNDFIEPWVSNTIPSHKKKSCGLRIPRRNFGGRFFGKKKGKYVLVPTPPFLKLELWIPGGMLSLMCHIEINIAKEKESRSLFHNTFTLQVIRS